MSAQDSGGPVFPGTEANGLNSGWSGLEMRDYFAAKALQGLLASDVEATQSQFAENAYLMADAMLKARAK